MKYVIMLWVWMLFLAILFILKIGVVVKFMPYILIVTFIALIVATWKVVREDVTIKEKIE